jgi:heme exporter protein A
MSQPLEQGLSCRDLSCIRDDRILFEQLDFDIEQGQALQIEGRNGSGKTSLLRILCGLALAETGTIYWQGQDTESQASDYRAAMTYVGHLAGIKGELSAEENLLIHYNLSLKPRDIDVLSALEQLGLRGFEDLPTRMLSAGQKRRVALARLLIADTPLWILDEPFTALDKDGVLFVEEMLQNHAKAGGIAVLTSHNPFQSPHVQRLQL